MTPGIDSRKDILPSNPEFYHKDSVFTVSQYEMDSFPRRSITNKLKNAQALKDKKKMRIFYSNNQTPF